MSRKWSPDKRAAERESAVLEVGGYEWHPRRKTNRLTAEVQLVAQEAQDLVKDLGKDDDIPTSITEQFNSLLYQQIAMLVESESVLVEVDGVMDPFVAHDAGGEEIPHADADGSPNVEWLKQALDIEDATPTLAFLMGRDPEKVIEEMQRVRDGLEDDDTPGEAAGESTPSLSPTPTSPASPTSSESGGDSPVPTPEPNGNEAAAAPVPAAVEAS